jgi:hypothetical protein
MNVVLHRWKIVVDFVQGHDVGDVSPWGENLTARMDGQIVSLAEAGALSRDAISEMIKGLLMIDPERARAMSKPMTSVDFTVELFNKRFRVKRLRSSVPTRDPVARKRRPEFSCSWPIQGRQLTTADKIVRVFRLGSGARQSIAPHLSANIVSFFYVVWILSNLSTSRFHCRRLRSSRMGPLATFGQRQTRTLSSNALETSSRLVPVYVR